MFLFFACLAPAVGFGALYGAATGNAIGTVEMITSTAASGVIYALTAGQPLTIIGRFSSQSTKRVNSLQKLCYVLVPTLTI
jgi:hypothetical protein